LVLTRRPPILRRNPHKFVRREPERRPGFAVKSTVFRDTCAIRVALGLLRRSLGMAISRSGFIISAMLVVLSLGSPVRAQVPFDHLLCHEVHTPRAALDEAVDLDALNPAFSAIGCHITGRTKLFCEPAIATGFVPPTQVPSPPGQDLTTSYTCYTLKCPTPNRHHDPVVDEFGVGFHDYDRRGMLCVPAVSGRPSDRTTTTTTTTPDTTTTTVAEDPVCDNPSHCRHAGRMAADGF
jgi:hypothetical protein